MTENFSKFEKNFRIIPETWDVFNTSTWEVFPISEDIIKKIEGLKNQTNLIKNPDFLDKYLTNFKDQNVEDLNSLKINIKSKNNKSTQEYISKLEYFLSKKLEEITSPSIERTEFNFEINWEKYLNSIAIITHKIWLNITWKLSNYRIWLLYLKEIKKWKTAEEAEEICRKHYIESEEDKKNKIEDYLDSPEKISELEKIIWKKIEEIKAIKDENTEFKITINWRNKTDSIKKLINRIWLNITWKKWKYKLWLDYLLGIKNWKTTKEAKEICRKNHIESEEDKKNKTEDYLDSPEKISELEKIIWKKIEEIKNFQNKPIPFNIVIDWKKRSDSIINLLNRIWRKISWKNLKYETWLLYLKKIKEWKTKKETEKICKKHLNKKEAEKKIKIIDYLDTKEKILELEIAIWKKIEEIINPFTDTKKIKLTIKWQNINETIKNLTGKIAYNIIWKNSLRSIGILYLKEIKNWETKEKAKEICKNIFLQRE